jgi:hypothetical protein
VSKYTIFGTHHASHKSQTAS